MVKNYKTKLKIYFSILGALIFVSTVAYNKASAQIVYTDVMPDQKLTTTNGYSVFSVDFDNDGTAEINIELKPGSISANPPYNYSNYCTQSLSLSSNTNTTLGVVHSTAYGPINTTLAMWDTIGSTQTYAICNPSSSGCNGVLVCEVASSNKACTEYSYDTYAITNPPYFPADFDGYMGVAFIMNGNTYYGWIRFAVSKYYKSFTVKSFAYEAIPGQLIRAGDNGVTAVLNSTQEESKISYYENILTLKEMTEGGNVKMFTSNGVEVFNNQVKEGDNNYFISNLHQGIYAVKVNLGDKIITKKVIVY